LKPPTIGAGGVGSGIRDKNSIISGLTPNTEYLVTIRAQQGDNVGNPAVISQSTGNFKSSVQGRSQRNIWWG